MFWLNTQSDTDGLKLVSASRVLSASHASGEVVGDDDRDVRLVVDGIEQSGHSRVGEGGVADDGNSREESCISSSLRHGDRRSHIHAA